MRELLRFLYVLSMFTGAIGCGLFSVYQAIAPGGLYITAIYFLFLAWTLMALANSATQDR